jgi:hypothetical protein
MVQVQDAVVGTGRAVPVGVAEPECGPTQAEGGEVVAWAASVPARGVRTERGMVSAEWAVGIIAAIAVAGVLLAVVTSGPVEDAILKFILTVIKAFSKNL